MTQTLVVPQTQGENSKTNAIYCNFLVTVSQISSVVAQIPLVGPLSSCATNAVGTILNVGVGLVVSVATLGVTLRLHCGYTSKQFVSVRITDIVTQVNSVVNSVCVHSIID